MRRYSPFAIALLAAQPAPAQTPAATAGYFAPMPAAAPGTRITFDDDAIFYGDYMAYYWSRPGALTRSTDPSADARGNVMPKPPLFGGQQKYAGAAAMRRKLDAVFPRLLAHPALANIRGASLRPGGSFGRRRGGPMDHAIAGTVSLIAYPVTLSDKATIAYPDGTFHTSGEGPVLRVGVNDTQELEGRAPVGTWNGMAVLRDGFMLVVPNTDRALYVTGDDGRQIVNPDLIDRSRPSTDIQFMTIQVGTDSSTHSEIVRQRVHPTANVGRLVGVMYNTDWRALLAEVNSVR